LGGEDGGAADAELVQERGTEIHRERAGETNDSLEHLHCPSTEPVAHSSNSKVMRLRTPATSIGSPLTTFGLYLNLSAAWIAARSKIPGGCDSITTGSTTAPVFVTVNSSSTWPSMPRVCARRGYTGATFTI